MANRKDRARFRIGDLLVQPDRLLVITDDGREIPLEPRMMDVLVALAENAGQTLSANRLLIDIWIHEFYGDNPVHKAIAQLRRAIGDDSRAPRYIETIRKRGYRLIAPVTFPEDYRRSPRQSDAWTNGSPYVGLVPFDEAHAGVFFGRNRMTAELLAAMRSQIDSQRRFVLIVGASGCGKTSLLRAGAIPLLTREGGFDGLRALSLAHCDLAAMHAGGAITALATALTTWTLCERPVFPPQPIDDLKKLLTESPESIRRIIEEAFRRHTERGLDEQPYAHLLLTIDHAESLVAASNVGPETFTTFSRALQSLCDSPLILVTMIARSDFYPKLIEALPELTERKAGDGHLDVLIPRQGEISEIIRKPGILAGLTFEEDPQTLAHLDDVLRDAALAQPDALPLLQHTLQALYERRSEKNELTFAAYRGIGGLEGAIAHRAEEIFATLTDDAQSQLDSLLAQLIVMQPDSDAISARRPKIDALGEGASKFVEAFVGARLFVSGLSDGVPTFGVAHEALLRQWPRAREWANNNHRLLHAQARLQRAAARWAEEGRRIDHLLNSGRPLAEALEVADARSNDLDANQRDFVRASKRVSHRNRVIRNGAIIVLCAFSAGLSALSVYALRARDEAERRKIQTAELTSYMIGELANKFDSTGNLELIESVGTKMLSYCTGISRDRMSQSELINCSRAFRKVGKVRMAQSKMQQAHALFQQSLAFSTKASHLHPQSEDAQLEAGESASWMGQYHRNIGDPAQAIKYWRAYASRMETMMKAHPGKSKWAIQTSYALSNIGLAERDSGNMETALHDLSKSAMLKAEAMKSAQRHAELSFEKVVTDSLISSIHIALGRLEQASQGHAQQIDALNALIKQHPSADDWKRQLTSLLQLDAKLALDMGDIPRARTRIDQCLDMLYELTGKQPRNMDWKRYLVQAHIVASDTSRFSGDISKALSHLDSATKLSHGAPALNSWVRIKATTEVKRAQLTTGRSGTKEIDSSVENLKNLIAADSKDRYALSALLEALIVRGEIHMRSGRRDEARQDLVFVLAAAKKYGQPNPDFNLECLSARADLLMHFEGDMKPDIGHLLKAGYRNHDFMRLFDPEAKKIKWN